MESPGVTETRRSEAAARREDFMQVDVEGSGCSIAGLGPTAFAKADYDYFRVEG
jgi:hypothetical protein